MKLQRASGLLAVIGAGAVVCYAASARSDLWGPNKWDSSDVSIWCDQLTGRQYVIVKQMDGLAITPRLDAPSCKQK